MNAQQIWEAVSLSFEVEPVFLYLYTLHFQGVALGGLTEADLMMLQKHAMVKHIEQVRHYEDTVDVGLTQD